MKIALARRGSPAWHSSTDVVRDVYGRWYGAEVHSEPDCFLVAHEEAAREASEESSGAAEDRSTRSPLAVAGLTFGSADRPFFSERYLDGPLERRLRDLSGGAVDRERIVEVGSLASRVSRTGLELIRLTPIVAWCLGMEYILCTATRQLTATFARVGIEFVPYAPADPGVLDAEERACWGSYYEQAPQVGVIPLNALHRLFTEMTGRYSLLDLTPGAPTEELVGHAGR
ncbi:thermostable hemolysin [Kitasatospora sp. NPDC004240]